MASDIRRKSTHGLMIGTATGHMDTNTLAAGVIGFLLGGLTVSIAAGLEDDKDPAPSHGSSLHRSIGG